MLYGSDKSKMCGVVVQHMQVMKESDMQDHMTLFQVCRSAEGNVKHHSVCTC